MARKSRRKTPQNPLKASPFRNVAPRDPAARDDPATRIANMWAAVRTASARVEEAAGVFAANPDCASIRALLLTYSTWRLGNRRLIGALSQAQSAGATGLPSVEDVRASERSMLQVLRQIAGEALCRVADGRVKTSGDVTARAAALELLGDLRIRRRPAQRLARVGTLRYLTDSGRSRWTIAAHRPGPTITLAKATYDRAHDGIPVLVEVMPNGRAGTVTILDPAAVKRRRAQPHPRGSSPKLPPGRVQHKRDDRVRVSCRLSSISAATGRSKRRADTAALPRSSGLSLRSCSSSVAVARAVMAETVALMSA